MRDVTCSRLCGVSVARFLVGLSYIGLAVGTTWAQSTTALQVTIAFAAIALLTKKRWLEYAMFGVAVIGLGIGVLAMLHI